MQISGADLFVKALKEEGVDTLIVHHGLFWKGSLTPIIGPYKDRLNAIFATNVDELKSFRIFTEQNISYRTMTMFNFLGEKRQGILQDF